MNNTFSRIIYLIEYGTILFCHFVSWCKSFVGDDSQDESSAEDRCDDAKGPPGSVRLKSTETHCC